MHHIEDYTRINFRNHPKRYRIGIGEQGVLMAEPYKSEILPYWKFKTPDIAKTSADKIYDMFLKYLNEDDFVGADMARKYLQMGFTRARRYANHPTGRKYDKNKKVIPQDENWEHSEKAQSAKIFKEIYDKARINEKYLALKEKHKKLFISQKV
jgi:Domain of unknown function (DUF4385)